MKWLFFLVVLFALMDISFPSTAFTKSEKPVVLKTISHKNFGTKETITFNLAAPVVPKIFTLGGDNPRLVIDFPQSIYWGKNTMALSESRLASDIRIGLHRTPVEKTRVVIDLSKDKPVQYTSEYLARENTLIVTLSPGSTASHSTATPKLQAQRRKTPPIQDKLAGEMPKSEHPIVPMIQEISFDDSTGKGERVLFRLNDFYPPTVSATEQGSPKIFCDFEAMTLGPKVQKTIPAKGEYIESIQTITYQDSHKVRVILELSADRDYDLQQTFYRKDNLFVLAVNEVKPNQKDK